MQVCPEISISIGLVLPLTDASSLFATLIFVFVGTTSSANFLAALLEMMDVVVVNMVDPVGQDRLLQVVVLELVVVVVVKRALIMVCLSVRSKYRVIELFLSLVKVSYAF